MENKQKDSLIVDNNNGLSDRILSKSLKDKEKEVRSFFPGSNKEGVRRFVGPTRIVILIGLVALVFLTLHLRQIGLLKPNILESDIHYYPIRATVLFIVIYTTSIMSSLPTLPLNLAAGFFWGGLSGGFIATLASGMGAIISFFSARLIFGQPLAQKFDHRLVTQLQNEFDQKGWRFIAFVRLNPIFPTGLLNYIFGLTSISFWTYAWASIIFLFPPSLLLGIISDRAVTLLEEGKTSDLMRTILVISLSSPLLLSLRFFARLISQTKEGR